LLFMKWFVFHCCSIWLWKDKRNRMGFF
jgi:hypothetical protein